MKPTLDLQMGRDLFTLIDLLGKAAAHKGCQLGQTTSHVYSKPFKTYLLDDARLNFLETRGIKRQARPDCNYDTFTLVDGNPQKSDSGFRASNYWNFFAQKGKESKFDLKIDLVLGFGFSERKRGILLLPLTRGASVSPCDHLPNYRMFKALVESDNDAPALAKEVISRETGFVVGFTELGLGGIRSLSNLFDEFARDRESVTSLAQNQQIFDPHPWLRHQQPGEALYIIEPAQPRVFKAWQAQLEEFKSSLG